MIYYIVNYVDGRIKSGYFWTDGEAEQFAKDFSLGYSYSIEVYDNWYHSLIPTRVL